ncbi:MAG: methyltransferase domain-containing protein [Desulfobaccales bacterium]|nr:methyltransferase domain-containing protein [Desulfobaccales bacterium]
MNRSPEGLIYLNLGCGSHFHKEWNNLDLFRHEHVEYHDLRQPLPYPADTFAAVYCSHVLEHLTPSQGKSLAQEIYRVLAEGGVVRIVVPDLEEICREYLARLAAAQSEPSEENISRYLWLTLELLDQLVRDKPGGLMAEVLQRRQVDEPFITERCGDEFAAFFNRAGPPESGAQAAQRSWAEKIISKLVSHRAAWQALKSRLKITPDPRRTGEAHRWMYDRLSLRLLLEEAGLVDFAVKKFDDSDIPHWDRYNLDRSLAGHGPRKPDSIYVEGKKPSGVAGLKALAKAKL